MRIVTETGRVLHEGVGELAGASLQKLHLAGAQLMGQDLTSADLSGSNLNSADLSNANLTAACLDDVVMQNAVCMDTKFNGARMQRADLYWVLAAGASFVGADLSYAKFNGADLKDADFTSANLIGADFGRDNLNGATSVCGANFANARLANVRWEGAEYDARTIFPPGFSPEKHGLIQSRS